MKKRWLLTGLFALALCACAASAQAAVTSGGVEYVWYTDAGRGESNENNQFVSYEGHQFYLSADQGGSYAVLPGLNETQKRTGLSYSLTVEATENGGLSVKGRDTWSSEYTWFREYSAQELAAALEKPAKVTPVRVHATNGTVTVGSRYVRDYGNDDPTKPGSTGTNLLNGAYAGDRIVYSTDGVTWLPAEGECKLNWLGSIWWDGSAFRSSDGHISQDGVHWTGVWTGEPEEWLDDPTYALSCELGPYRFEVYDGEVYLMGREAVDTGVLLPHMGEAARAKWINIGKLRAWYGPNDTVILAAYDVYSKEDLMVSIDYPISSLDWCLENLKTQFRMVEAPVSNGTVSLGMVERRRVAGAGNDREMAYNDGSGWKWVENVPWGSSAYLEPYSGKTFVATSASHVYASEDGLSWREVEALYAGPGDYTNCDLAWTGKGYIARRHTGTSRSGMFGMSGGNWQEGFSEVYLLDEDFQIISTYDFGRLVQSVGWYDGAYYAKVANSDGHRNGWAGDGVFDSSLGSTLYRSTDGKTWEKLPDIYVTADDIMVSTQPKWENELRVMGTEEKPVCSVAKLDRWRFVLNEYFAWDFERDIREDHPTYKVYLMGDSAADWVELPHLGEAIKAQGVDPWEVLAAYNPDGTVEVKVTDKNDPAKYISISYPTSSLDWVKENLMGVNGRELPAYSGTNNDAWDIVSKYGVADLVAVELANGERELVYRSEATGGHWKWYDSAPWGNAPKLLSFSGKDFMVYENGGLFRSSDGVNWSKAESEWIDRGGRRESTTPPGHPYQNWRSDPTYRFLWTGTGYLASCYQTFGLRFAAYTPNADAGKVAFLDDDLNLLSTHDFGHVVQRIGYKDGVYYAQTDVWDLQFEPPRWDEGAEDTLWRSTDGVNWEATDILQVRECLRGLQ